MSWSFYQLQINTQNTKSLKKKKTTFRKNTLKGNPLVFFTVENFGVRTGLSQWFKQSVFSQQFLDKRQIFSNSSSRCQEHTADLDCIQFSLLFVSAKKISYEIWYLPLTPLNKKAFNLGCIYFQNKQLPEIGGTFSLPR